MKVHTLKSLALAGSLMFLTACTSSQVGTTLGGAAGAGLGYAVGGGWGAAIGGGTGALLGYEIGKSQNKRYYRN